MQDAPSDRAKAIALPPLILAAILAIGLLLDFLWPAAFAPSVYAFPVGLSLIFAAIALAVLAVLAMARAQTSPDIRKPTKKIVTSGVFAWTRNPIYLSMVLISLGVAFSVNSLWLLALTAPLAAILQKGVIEAEESYLEQKFGQTYLRYKASVRRWL